jgi:plastocyanin
VKYLRYALPLSGAALSVVVAACGAAPGTVASAPVAAGSPPGMTMSATPGGQGQETPAATNSVVIKNFAFSPAAVTVAVGTTVAWTNSDQDPHTVTASGGGFTSPTLNTGDTFRFTFTKAGRYEYLCTIHPFMTATVVVTP